MAAAQPNPYHPGVSTVPPGKHFDAAASTANGFLHPKFLVQGNYQCGDEPEYTDGGSDDDDYFYQQQQIDYAELQRQDAEYESQLEQQDVHIPSILQYAAAPCKAPTPGSAAQTHAPVYYQGPPTSQPQQGPTIEKVCTGESCLPAPLTLDANNVVGEADHPRLPSILSWADDADECLFGDREPSPNAENESCGDSDSPHDSDFFNLSSTSSITSNISPTKSAASGANASFTNDSFKQQQFLSALDAEIPDEVTRCPTTTTTYCNYGYLQYNEFLDLDEQRSMVAEDRWRENASWIERHAEAAKFSSVGRKVAVKLLIDEAYRLDKAHVVGKYGSASGEAAQVTATWTKIGKEALAEMDSAPSQMEFGGQCPDPSQNVIRKFSSMAIFIAGSGSRFYSENEEGKFTRLEAQAKVLDTLIFQGCLFVDELDD